MLDYTGMLLSVPSLLSLSAEGRECRVRDKGKEPSQFKSKLGVEVCEASEAKVRCPSGSLSKWKSVQVEAGYASVLVSLDHAGVAGSY